jgi:hypothetical protein
LLALRFGAFLTTGLSFTAGLSTESADAVPDKLLATHNTIAQVMHEIARIAPPCFHDKSLRMVHSRETVSLHPLFA